ncbi:MAG: hypothetical protein ACLTDX_04865 [[Clostridium] innocuum]
MFQQNRYNKGRYRTWLVSYIRLSWKLIVKILLTLMLSYSLLLLQPTSMQEVLLLMLVAIFAYISCKMEEERVYRKPLVKTARIHRLAILLYTAIRHFAVPAALFPVCRSAHSCDTVSFSVRMAHGAACRMDFRAAGNGDSQSLCSGCCKAVKKQQRAVHRRHHRKLWENECENHSE